MKRESVQSMQRLLATETLAPGYREVIEQMVIEQGGQVPTVPVPLAIKAAPAPKKPAVGKSEKALLALVLVTAGVVWFLNR